MLNKYFRAVGAVRSNLYVYMEQPTSAAARHAAFQKCTPAYALFPYSMGQVRPGHLSFSQIHILYVAVTEHEIKCTSFDCII